MAAIGSVPQGSAYDFEQVTIDNTAGGVGLTASKYAPAGPLTASRAMITLTTAQIRFTLDATAPTATAGLVMDIGDVLEIDSANDIKNFKAIRTGASSGVIDVQYFR